VSRVAHPNVPPLRTCHRARRPDPPRVGGPRPDHRRETPLELPRRLHARLERSVTDPLFERVSGGAACYLDRVHRVLLAFLAACGAARGHSSLVAVPTAYARVFERDARWTFDVAVIATPRSLLGPATSTPKPVVTCTVDRVRVLSRTHVAHVACTGDERLVAGLQPPAGTFVATARGLWWFDDRNASAALSSDPAAREMLLDATPRPRTSRWVEHRFGEEQHFQIVNARRGDQWCATYTTWIVGEALVAGYEVCLRDGEIVNAALFTDWSTRYETRYTARP
jgi:hypothetical protein